RQPWSPDGRTIAFTSKRDGPWELYTMDVVTRQITRLTTSQDFVGAPTWSPDGTFLAYEGYNQETQNLDIYIVAVDRSQGPIQLTYNPGPDIEPAWMPDTGGSSGGRLIAYTSIRNGRQDIYVIDLDNPDEGAALNLTNTADFLENHPAWSPDGRRITYSAVVNGIESIYIRSLATPSDVQIVGRGSMPVWNPVDGSSIFYSQRLPGKQSAISGGLPGSFGSSSAENLVNGIVADLDWTPAEPSITAVVADYPPVPPVVDIEPDADGLYSLAVLQSVEAPEPYLNARVYPAFNALRFKMLDVAGLDFLSTLEDAFWDLSRSPELGQQRESWHYAGRAFAIPRGLVSQGNPTPIVVVREEGEIGTYWRVYVRVAEQAQGGALGEPLRQTPWDFDARTSGDPEAFEQGGKLMDTVPSGYYVDFTQLAADHGWERLPADRRWRQNFPDVLFWVFIKRDNLDWETAMQELYTDEQLRRFLNDEPVETTPLPTTSPEEGTTEAPAETIEATSTPAPTETLPFRTSTPIPPDILER
ncbi:MAG: hypothetical protein GYB66_01685, partial [Chloroflexi bacterium]|nr:hypothetical protein [Chloroflexota bacterium]